MADPQTFVVVGGGAAGFYCAVNAARMDPSLHVILLEKTSKLLSKVKVSGGGRCNVTHACFHISEMSKNYPRGGQFVKKTFGRHFTTDVIAWFEARGLTLKKEEDGRMFPITNSSQSVIDCLLNEAAKYKVDVRMQADVKSISHDNVTGNFRIDLSNGVSLNTKLLCIASGGFPKSSQFEWLTSTGHHIEEPVPSLFTFNMPANSITSLMGITVPHVQVKIIGSKLQNEGPLLITHWGMSGPAILKLSAWAARELAEKNYHFSILINWLPGYHEQSLKTEFQRIRFDHAAQKIVNRNSFKLPSRLWEYFVQLAGIHADLRWADLAAREQNKLIKLLCAYESEVKGKTTFKEEFVTAGGIRLDEIDPGTMESRLIRGLFFAGEVMNVDGVTGGFNFQHAWTSGYIAAQGAIERAAMLRNTSV